MRNIVASLFISLDGVIESPDKWTSAYWNDEMEAAVGALWQTSDAMLLGRVTYQEFAPAWSDRTTEEDAGADFMNATPKYVVSHTLDRADWNNTTVLGGDLADEIGRLKSQDGQDISVSGSATLVRSLIQGGHLDLLHLFLYPVTLGSGKRLFPDGAEPATLTLSASAALTNGVQHLTYAPQRSKPTA